MSWHQKFGSLYVDVSAATDKLKTDLKRSEDMSRRAGSRAGNKFAAAFGKARGLAGRMGFGGTLAGGAGVFGLAAMAKSSLAAADSIGKTADKIGITTDLLQELRYTGGQAGMSMGELDISMGMFVKRLGEASLGVGEAARSLGELGINIKGVDGSVKGTRFLLGEVADKMNAISSSSIRAAHANALFGRSGIGMLNVLRLGSKGIDDYGQKLHDLGGVIEERLVRKAERTNDKMDDLSQSLKGKMSKAILENAESIEMLAETGVSAASKLGTAAKAGAVAKHSVPSFLGWWARGFPDKGDYYEQQKREAHLLSSEGLQEVAMNPDKQRAARSAQRLFGQKQTGMTDAAWTAAAKLRGLSVPDIKPEAATQAAQAPPVVQNITVNGGNYMPPDEMFQEMLRLGKTYPLTP